MNLKGTLRRDASLWLGPDGSYWFPLQLFNHIYGANTPSTAFFSSLSDQSWYVTNASKRASELFFIATQAKLICHYDDAYALCGYTCHALLEGFAACVNVAIFCRPGR